MAAKLLSAVHQEADEDGAPQGRRRAARGATAAGAAGAARWWSERRTRPVSPPGPDGLGLGAWPSAPRLVRATSAVEVGPNARSVGGLRPRGSSNGRSPAAAPAVRIAATRDAAEPVGADGAGETPRSATGVTAVGALAIERGAAAGAAAEGVVSV